MTLNILHTISGLLILIFFSGKVILHYYLYRKQDNSINFLGFLATPTQYLWPYKKNVDYGNLRLQRTCNLFLILTYAALLANIILGIAIYLNK